MIWRGRRQRQPESHFLWVNQLGTEGWPSVSTFRMRFKPPAPASPSNLISD